MRFRIKGYVFLGFVLFIGSSFVPIQTFRNEKSMADSIIGYWSTPKKDLKFRVYEYKGKYCGKLSYFSCYCKVKTSLEDHKDVKNPDPACRNNSWLETNVLWGLAYVGNNRWENGYIYDLSSGTTYRSVVTRINNTLKVRGYWGFEFIGKTLTFYKETY